MAQQIKQFTKNEIEIYVPQLFITEKMPVSQSAVEILKEIAERLNVPKDKVRVMNNHVLL